MGTNIINRFADAVEETRRRTFGWNRAPSNDQNWLLQ